MVLYFFCRFFFRLAGEKRTYKGEERHGLHQFYKDLALRFAEIGVAAIAMDYFQSENW